MRNKSKTKIVDMQDKDTRYKSLGTGMIREAKHTNAQNKSEPMLFA